MTDGRFPWGLVTVDIDGTLTTTHGWQVIADAFGRRPEFEEANRRFHAHEVDEDVHLREFLELAVGHTLPEVAAVLERTPKLSGIAEGVADLHRRGARAAILSHNPTYVVDWYRRRFGFDDAEGVDGQAVVDGRLAMPGTIRADKPAGLRRLLARHPVPVAQVVHVGDGASDALVFRLVGGGVALNSSADDVDRAADLVVRSSDFREVVGALGDLRPRRPLGSDRQQQPPV